MKKKKVEIKGFDIKTMTVKLCGKRIMMDKMEFRDPGSMILEYTKDYLEACRYYELDEADIKELKQDGWSFDLRKLVRYRNKNGALIRYWK